MHISDELVSQFVRATRDINGYPGEVTAYGTIVVYGTTTYVRLDGSDILTPIVSTTEVNNGERVIVRLKNHTATVTGNVDNPSIGKVRVGQLESSIEQTASQIRLEVKDEVEKLSASITLTASEIRSEVSNDIAGLDSKITQTATDIRSELSDEVEGLNSTITQTATDIRSEVTAVSEDLDGVESTLTSKIEQNASSITTLVTNQNEFSEFQQTVEGFSFMGTGGTVKIQGGDINLTGAITFSDLSTEVTDELDSIESTADSASSTANSALSTANSASSTANNALSTANSATTTANNASYNAGQALTKANSAEAAAAEAKSIAQGIDLPDYLKSTYIDSTTIISPVIHGGRFYAVDQTAWAEMSAAGLSVYTGGVAIPKIQLLNDDEDIYLFLGSGVGVDNTTGRFLIRKSRYMTRLFYYSSATGLPCGFTFNDDLTIDVSGTLNV